MNKYEKLLHNEFLAERESNPELDKLINEIDDRVQIFIFGGWCRDKIHKYLYEEHIASSDIDLVINGNLKEPSFGNFFRTHFGGFRLKLKTPDRFVDFWALSNTFAFVEGFLTPTVDNLLKSTVFDVNSILFDIQNSQIINGLALGAIKDRKIGFNCTRYLDSFAYLQAYRALYLAHKLNYQLKEDVLSFITNLLSEHSFEEFADNVQKYRAYVPRDTIYKLYSNHLVSASQE